MPELPEVETTKRGLADLITNNKVVKIGIYKDKMRFEIPKHLKKTLKNQVIKSIARRGKYLLFKFDVGFLILHLGMSGSILVVDKNKQLKKHDHFELVFKDKSMRLNDPRRFGCVLFSKDGRHKLLNNLGVEPLSELFDDKYLYKHSRKKKQNIKAFIMNSKVVVGVGNIYACESLFMARINPRLEAGKVSKKAYQILTKNIKEVLKRAIKAGGTTLQDFSNINGKPGYFAQTLSVYGRENKTCSSCGGKISKIIQNQRSTFYCPICQI